MAGKRISSSTGITAEGTFKGLLPRVQLDVTEQVTLLSEGGATLITLEWSLTCGKIKLVNPTSLTTSIVSGTRPHS